MQINTRGPLYGRLYKQWLYGEGGGKEIQEGGDICIPMADSCECMAETNTII